MAADVFPAQSLHLICRAEGDLSVDNWPQFLDKRNRTEGRRGECVAFSPLTATHRSATVSRRFRDQAIMAERGTGLILAQQVFGWAALVQLGEGLALRCSTLPCRPEKVQMRSTRPAVLYKWMTPPGLIFAWARANSACPSSMHPAPLS